MNGSEESITTVEHVGDVPICPGCGLASHIDTDVGICWECFNRRERWMGGGQLRVVTQSGTYHETPLCPSARNAKKWYFWRDEDCCYADLAGRMDKCIRCHSHRTFGFDHYDGGDRTVIGHA